MLEKYAELKILFEYTIPFILLCIGIGIYLLCVIIGAIINAWDKRQKRLSEKYFGKEKSEVVDSERN